VPLEDATCTVLLQDPVDDAMPEGLLLSVGLATGA
jgi:hypothetical protein